jgi:hypothetical protein
MREGFGIVRRKATSQFSQLRSVMSNLSDQLSIATLFAVIVAATIAASAVRAENDGVTTRRNFERIAFSDAEIADGFFKIALVSR